MSTFATALDNIPNKASFEVVSADEWNELVDAINAIQTALGVDLQDIPNLLTDPVFNTVTGQPTDQALTGGSAVIANNVDPGGAGGPVGFKGLDATATAIEGNDALGVFSTASATDGVATGGFFQAIVGDGGTNGSASAIRTGPPTLGAGATALYFAGLEISSVSGATENYGIDIGDVSSGTAAAIRTALGPINFGGATNSNVYLTGQSLAGDLVLNARSATTVQQRITFEAAAAGAIKLDAVGGIIIDAVLGATSLIPLKIYGQASQTGNLTEWRNDANDTLSGVTAAGWLGVGTGAPGTTLETQETKTLTGALTIGQAAAWTHDARYDQTFVVSRHSVIDFLNPTLTNGATMTDAALVRYNAAAGSHKGVDAGTGIMAGWEKRDLNGTIGYVGIQSAKTNPLTSAYGQLYEDNASGTALVVTTAGTYYQWVSTAAGNSSGVTLSTASDDMTIDSGSDGQFLVQFSVSVENSTLNASTEFAVFLNGTRQPKIVGEWDQLSAGDIIPISAVGTLSLVATDVLTLRVTSDTSAVTVTIYHAQLTICKIG